MFKKLIQYVIQKLTGNESLPSSPKYPFSTIGDMSLTNECPKEIKTLLDLTKKLHGVLTIYNVAGYNMQWKTDKVDKLLSQSQDLIKHFEQVETTQQPSVENSVVWGDLLKEADEIVRRYNGRERVAGRRCAGGGKRSTTNRGRQSLAPGVRQVLRREAAHRQGSGRYRNSSNGYYGGDIYPHRGALPESMTAITDDWQA